jgi:hypothetical protein
VKTSLEGRLVGLRLRPCHQYYHHPTSEEQMMSDYAPSKRISKLEATEDTLTGRGGLALFSRYLTKVGLLGLLAEKFGHLRKSKKGLPVAQVFKQLFCFFFDGTSRHLTHFDTMKKDAGYAGAIEEAPPIMLSSHAVKRFFRLFSLVAGGVFRRILRRLFLWRLNLEKPQVIELSIDTMVMQNDEALKRHGVGPTYKKVKGFQPLQIIWQGRIVDAIFRGGKKNGNHGDSAVRMVKEVVRSIRKHYHKEATIILRLDAGFYDQENFRAFDELGIGFIATGKMYAGVKEQVQQAGTTYWGRYDNGRQAWKYLEFGYRGDSWQQFWRALYTRPEYEDKQRLLEFSRPDNVILTNLSVNAKALQHLPASLQRHWQKPQTLISSHHGRGADELPHRGLKDFGFEQLPFKRFSANSAFYYCMLIGFFLFESFKHDVLLDVIPVSSYATTVRRRLVDFAAKLVKTGKQVILKVPQSIAAFLPPQKLRYNQISAIEGLHASCNSGRLAEPEPEPEPVPEIRRTR